MALFGRMLAAGFAGIGEGLAAGAKAQDERIAEERARRDKLMQQALIFAKNDKDKYDAAKENKRNLVSAIDARLAQYSDKFGSEQERLAASANIAKSYTTVEAANQYLNTLDENYARNSDSVNFEFTSKMDPKQLERMSLDTVSGALVPSYLRPKQWDTYYSPTDYQSDSIFAPSGTPASLRKQAEEGRKLGEAAGLTERYDEGAALPSVGLPKLTPKVRIESFQNQMFRSAGELQDAIKKGASPERIKELTAASEFAKKQYYDNITAEALAREKAEGVSMGATTTYIGTTIKAAGEKTGTYQTYITSPQMQKLFSIQDRNMDPSADVSFAAKQETAYQLAASARRIAGGKLSQKDENKILMGASNVLNKERLDEAYSNRLGIDGDYTALMDYLKGIDRGSEEYTMFQNNPNLVAHKYIIDYFNMKGANKQISQKYVTKTKKAFGAIMSRGYFVPDRLIDSNNFNNMFQQEFGIAPTYQ
jgi:hypothetical protein